MSKLIKEYIFEVLQQDNSNFAEELEAAIKRLEMKEKERHNQRGEKSNSDSVDSLKNAFSPSYHLVSTLNKKTK